MAPLWAHRLVFNSCKHCICHFTRGMWRADHHTSAFQRYDLQSKVILTFIQVSGMIIWGNTFFWARDVGHSSDPVTFYLNIDSRIRKCLVWGRVLHSWSCFHGRNQAVVEKKKKESGSTWKSHVNSVRCGSGWWVVSEPVSQLWCRKIVLGVSSLGTCCGGCTDSLCIISYNCTWI